MPWWPAVAAVVPVLLTVWAATPPGGYFSMALAGFLCWVAVGSAWLITGGLAVVSLPRPRRRHIAGLWPFLVVPAMLLSTWVATGTGVARHAAFAAHRPALEAVVADVRAAPGHWLGHRRVGLHEVSSARVDQHSGCALLTLTDAGFFESTGWAHCPGRAPVDVVGADGLTWEPLGGPWYEFAFRW